MTGYEASLQNRRYAYWVSSQDQPPQTLPIMLIHGFGGMYSGLEELSKKLTAHSTVLGLDLPGYGASEQLHRKHTLANYAAFLDQFCEQTKFHKVNVVGHSLGADIALLFASRFPQRVGDLVLLNPVLLTDRRVAALTKLYYDIAARAPKRLRRIILHSHAVTWFTDSVLFAQSPEGAKEKILRDDYISDHLMSDRPIIETYSSIHHTRFLEAAAHIKSRTLIVHGTGDKLTSSNETDALAAAIPGAVLKRVDGGGHFLPLEKPAVAARLILEFLAN
jgi:pimeloyl-ACP methyl ester carboxylesterase